MDSGLVSKQIQDDPTDSLFREMIQKNLLLISIVVVLIVAVSFFLYPKVTITYFKIKREICLTSNGTSLSGYSLENQKYLRLLKQQEIRSKIVTKYDLAKVYGIDKNHKNAIFQLDKALIDRLKVEEQSKGEIHISCADNSSERAEKIITELANLALLELQKTNPQPLKWKIVQETKTKVEPKFIYLLLLISAPVLLALIIFIAIKQKIYIDLANE